jgi:hypothetical protein
MDARPAYVRETDMIDLISNGIFTVRIQSSRLRNTFAFAFAMRRLTGVSVYEFAHGFEGQGILFNLLEKLGFVGIIVLKKVKLCQTVKERGQHLRQYTGPEWLLGRPLWWSVAWRHV